MKKVQMDESPGNSTFRFHTRKGDNNYWIASQRFYGWGIMRGLENVDGNDGIVYQDIIDCFG